MGAIEAAATIWGLCCRQWCVDLCARGGPSIRGQLRLPGHESVGERLAGQRGDHGQLCPRTLSGPP